MREIESPEIPPTARGRMELLLEGIQSGRVKIHGFEDSASLNGVVLPLSDLPDMSLRQGDVLPFGRGRAIVDKVGVDVSDEHIFYDIRFDLSSSPEQ